MVKVTELPEETPLAAQASTRYEDDDEYEDYDGVDEYPGNMNRAEGSDDDDELYADDEEPRRNILEKIIDLKYMIPLSIRSRIYGAASTFRLRAFQVGSFLGNSLWVITTSLFLVGFPIFYAYQREQQMILMEKEQHMFPGGSSASQVSASG